MLAGGWRAGAGGLGAPLALYLAGAGIGRIGMVDSDRVALSNLPRQVLYETGDVGRLKTEAASDVLLERNPGVKLELYSVRLEENNAQELIKGYDIVADSCDHFQTRLAVNAACHQAQKTLVSAAVIGFAGQISTYKSHLGAPHPCYQCLIGEEVPEDMQCSAAGVLGSVAGTLACMQATEVMKEILGIGESLSGRFLHYDALAQTQTISVLPRDHSCKICG